MKRKRHSPEQIVRKLREAEGLLARGTALAEVLRQLEVLAQTYHRWKAQYQALFSSIRTNTCFMGDIANLHWRNGQELWNGIS